MDTTAIFIIGIAAAAVLAAAAVFTVAFRRGPSSAPITGGATGVLDKRAIQRDLAAREQREAAIAGEPATAVATLVDEDETPEEAPAPTPDPILERTELTAEEFGVARRQFFNRAILGLFGGAFLGGLTISFLAFLWPKLSGGFGSPINVGNLDDLRREMAQSDGTFSPRFVAAAQSWIVPWTKADGTAGTSFDGLPVVAGAEGGQVGLMALWQKCVHLGCRVPACVSSQGFECPCHGSKYNLHGEYEDGPAPRNLDRFGVEVTDRGELVVRTGDVFETSRARVKSVEYPQGPNCL
jgi:cytochrome b6-f complex iron-sulfur subunit